MSRRDRDAHRAPMSPISPIGARPDHQAATALVLVQRPPTPDQMALIGTHQGVTNTYVRAYTLGECSVLVTREGGRWHLSIAHPRRMPTWIELSRAWYRAVPGAAAMVGAVPLPPESEYINMHRFCLHAYENRDAEFIH